MIRLKRIYAEPEKSDGFRLLVERLWPRGVSKEKAALDLWMKELGPSPELRQWFGHDPEKWTEFQQRYHAELQENPAVETLRELLLQHRSITFVYAASDERNSASVLKAFLEKR